MAVVPYTFANQAGQIPLSQLDVNFANVKAFADTAGNVIGNVQANITAVGVLTSLSVSGNIIAASVIGNVTGNITGNLSGNISVPGSNTQILFNDNGVANSASTVTFNKSTNVLSATGNIVGGNIRTGGLVTATGNITGGNLLTAGVVTAAGNITGGNLLTAGVISAAGNVTSATNIVGANILISGLITAAGNITGGNILSSAQISATSNVTAANFLTTGGVSATGNVTGGNLSVTGTSIMTGVATAPTAANGTSNTQVATTAFVANSLLNLVPSGVIVMWSGSIASIPTGWFLCDGSNSTPDLRNKFIVGAGTTYTPGNTGGSADATVVAHTHTASSVVTDPGHNHSYTTYSSLQFQAGLTTPCWTGTATANTGSATTGITVATTVNSTGSSGTNANLPPYYALAYIMKA